MKRIGLISTVLLTLTLAACGDEDTSNPGNNTDSDTAFLTSCVGAEFQPSPFAGPGYEPGRGLLKAAQDSYIAHTTALLVRPDQLQLFEQLMAPILETLPTHPGLVGMSLSFSPGCGIARTVAVWESEAAMYEYVAGDAHLQAMLRASEVAQAGAVAHWTVTANEIPMSWDVALAKIAESEPFFY